MRLTHCNMTIRPYDVWFLFDNATDKNRRLLLVRCPHCKKDIVSLIEERKSDNRIFVQTESGDKATALIDRAIVKNDVVYTAEELKIQKGRPFGLCYGDNKEIHNNKGEVIKIRQSRCDWFGQKEVLKEVAV